MDDEFHVLGRGGRLDESVGRCTISIAQQGGRLSITARRLLGWPMRFEVAASRSGHVRLRPVHGDDINESTATMNRGGAISVVYSHCKHYGYRLGVYDVEIVDGVAFFQLAKDESSD